MLVLFDNGTPRTLARYLIEHHTVTEARARGWEYEVSAEPCRPEDSHRRIGKDAGV
jgi:hypothetical protein